MRWGVLGIAAVVVLLATVVAAQERPSPSPSTGHSHRSNGRTARFRSVRVRAWTELPSVRGLPLPLAGHVTGVLFRARLTAWGGEQEPGAAYLASYVLSIDGSMGYPVYFPSDGRGAHVARPYREALPDGSSFEVPTAALFTPATPNDFGLESELHVVDLEVNGGAGSSQAHFVATRVRVLDGTPELPMHPGDVLDSIEARIDRELRRDRAAIAGVRRHGAVVTDSSTVRATWHPAARTIETTYTLELATERRGSTIHERTDRCPPCRCTPSGICAPCVRCLPDTHAYVDVDARLLRLAIVHVVDADGHLRSETIYGPRVDRSRSTVDVGVTRAVP